MKTILCGATLDLILSAPYVDVGKYRYRSRIRPDKDGGHIVIERLPLSDLGTTTALKRWETVKTLPLDYEG